MNKKRSEWANEEGSALVLTLMIFLVLTVLATSISFLTVGSFRLSDINRDGTSAFYIAEAGAKRAYEEAKQEVMKTYEATTTTTSSNFYAALGNALYLNKERPFSFDKQFGDDATAKVIFTEIADSNPRKYTLTSTGSVGGKTRIVQKQFDVSWVDKGGSGGLPTLPANAALMTQGKIDLSLSAGKPFIGDIYTNSPAPGDKVNIHNSTSDFSTELFYPSAKTEKELLTNPNFATPIVFRPVATPIEWKTYTNLVNNIKIPKISSNTKKLADVLLIDYNAVHTLKIDSQEVYISSLSSRDNSTLILEPKYDNTVLFLDSWENVGNKVEIKGEKKVIIVVKNKLTMRNTIKINFEDNIINSADLVNKLTLIYSGTTKVDFEDLRIYGNIFIEEAKLTVDRGSSINGVLLYKGNTEIDIKNGGGISNMLLIAPFAKVSLAGLKINGTVIANEFRMHNGAQLTYPDPKPAPPSFPGISGGTTTPPTLENLITQSGPILEQ